MHVKRILIGLVALGGVWFAGFEAAHAQQAQGISQHVAVCNPDHPTQCAKPDASGNLPVTGGGGGGGNVTVVGPLGSRSAATSVSTALDTTDAANLATIATNSGLPSAVLGTDGATIASKTNPLDIEINGAVPAGTNLIGKVGIDQTTPGTTNGVQVVAGTTGGASSATFEVAASDNHQVIKNGAGTLFTMDGFSIHTAPLFVRLYDAGTGFNGCNSATGLLWEGQIPGTSGGTGAGFIKGWGDVGKAFATGLSICVTGAYGNTNTTSATASVASVNLGYK